MNKKEHEVISKYDMETLIVDTLDFDITSNKNFRNVFLLKNDSLYNDLWNDCFQEQPENAFYLSVAFYFLTRDTLVLDQINMSINQLETMYHSKINISKTQMEVK